MSDPSREDRLNADHASLSALDQASTIFSMEVTGRAARPVHDHVHAARGWGAIPSNQSEVTTVELHQIDLRMPYAYPQSPPDIRWITPIMHPNVSFSGFVNLADVGIVWTRETPVELVIERLWDVARGEFMNLDKATNYAAKNWFEKECRV